MRGKDGIIKSIMNFNEYQERSRVTAIYQNAGHNFIYPTLGLAGETGEVVEKIKKLYRNDLLSDPSQISSEKKEELIKEMGDVVWYLAQLATEFGISIDEIASKNLEKLLSRQERGVLHSQGDNR